MHMHAQTERGRERGRDEGRPREGDMGGQQRKGEIERERVRKKEKDLLLLQSELDEDLLQLFVDIVDADLFKAVVVKDFEASDVEDSYVGDFLHGFIDQRLVALTFNV